MLGQDFVSASIVLANIYFETDSYRLDAEDRSAIKKLYDTCIQLLQSGYIFSLNAEGSADHRGTRKYNLALSKKRAQSVQNFFDKTFVSLNGDSWVSPFALGEKYATQPSGRRPINPATLAADRRVDVVALLHDYQARFLTRKDQERWDAIRKKITEEFEIPPDAADEILDILGKIDDVTGMLDSVGLIAGRLSTFLSFWGIALTGASIARALYKASSVEEEEYWLISIAYFATYWVYGDPIPNGSQNTLRR